MSENSPDRLKPSNNLNRRHSIIPNLKSKLSMVDIAGAWKQNLKKIQSVIPKSDSALKRELEAIKMAERKILRKKDAHTEVRRRNSIAIA